MKEIPIGMDIFRDIRAQNCLYVDKTPFIREVLSGSRVLLLPRPRRFGKTLNMTMLHCFFDMTQRSRDLFEGLAITEDAEAMTHLNAYPTIFLSLKALAFPTWAECLEELGRQMAGVTEHHMSLLDVERLTPSTRARIDALSREKASSAGLAVSLKLLSEVLYQGTGKKTILLIDEYDAPIHAGLEKNYYGDVVSFFRVFLGEALKSNPYLERAVLTGILRVAKESIFSGLNNLEVCTILHEPFSTCFGFTDAEVEALVAEAKSPHPMAEIRQWYNGYCFGKTTIYNPWSILNMLKQGETALDAHWVNTSGNDLIRQQVQRGGCDLIQLETLLRGERIQAKLTSNLALRDITPEITWSLFLFAGYLTAENYDPSNQTADLYIPNFEVQRFFRDTVQTWLGSFHHSNELIKTLLQGKLELFACRLQETVVTILSYHDTDAKTPEKIFHVFILGLLAHLADRYQVQSNRESGYGRSDLQLIPRTPGQPAFVFEFKAAATADAETLRTAASAALDQATTCDYSAALRQAEVTTLYTLGLASHGKRIALASTVRSLPDGQPSERAYHLAGPEPEPRPKRARTTTKPKRSSAERDEKLTMVGKIQILQELKGRTPLPQNILMGLDLPSLHALLKDLNP